MPEQIEVWYLKADEASPAHPVFLDALLEHEQERAQRFYFSEDRLSFVWARGALRLLLRHYLGSRAAAVRFVKNPFGKPELEPESRMGCDIRFNLSHSGNHILLAFSNRREIGVDIERIRPHVRIAEIGAASFCTSELLAIQALPGASQQEAFFDCWCRKEAFVKAVGKGLTIPLDSFELSLSQSVLRSTVRAAPEVAGTKAWVVQKLPVERGCVAALAFESGSAEGEMASPLLELPVHGRVG